MPQLAEEQEEQGLFSKMGLFGKNKETMEVLIDLYPGV